MSRGQLHAVAGSRMPSRAVAWSRGQSHAVAGSRAHLRNGNPCIKGKVTLLSSSIKVNSALTQIYGKTEAAMKASQAD